MEWMSRLVNAIGTWGHTRWCAWVSLAAFVGLDRTSFGLLWILPHKCSICFKSGLSAGHGRICMLFWWRKSLVALAVWALAVWPTADKLDLVKQWGPDHSDVCDIWCFLCTKCSSIVSSLIGLWWLPMVVHAVSIALEWQFCSWRRTICRHCLKVVTRGLPLWGQLAVLPVAWTRCHRRYIVGT